MNVNYENEYRKIVQGAVIPVYRGPEEQGKAIQKCSILKPVGEIEYCSFSKEERKH